MGNDTTGKFLGVAIVLNMHPKRNVIVSSNVEIFIREYDSLLTFTMLFRTVSDVRIYKVKRFFCADL